jgi:hypothetical protein
MSSCYKSIDDILLEEEKNMEISRKIKNAKTIKELQDICNSPDNGRIAEFQRIRKENQTNEQG